MVARYTGACLGLLAFAVVTLAGVSVHNPPMLTLSRAVWALVLFCILGLALGATAQAVVNEQRKRREEALLNALAEQEGAHGVADGEVAESGGEGRPPEVRTA